MTRSAAGLRLAARIRRLCFWIVPGGWFHSILRVALAERRKACVPRLTAIRKIIWNVLLNSKLDDSPSSILPVFLGALGVSVANPIFFVRCMEGRRLPVYP